MPQTKQESELDSLSSDDSKDSNPKSNTESVDEQEREEMETTAIVPLKVLSPDGKPVKEGEEITVTVKAVHGDDEVEIAYAPKKESDHESMSSDDELESLGKENY